MITVHGGPPSQPSRAVFWACLLNGIPFRLALPDYLNTGTLASLNPRKQVPILVDGDFVLFEMAAILVYLCERYGEAGLLPGDIEDRARVHQYLHMHHSSSRCATMALMAPHVTTAFRAGLETKMANDEVMDPMQRCVLRAALADPDMRANGVKTVDMVARTLEAAYFRDGSPFLIGGGPTIADIACYSELGQLRWAGLHDFEGFAKIRRWIDAMAGVAHHDAIHRYNLALGDITKTPNTIENFVAANEAGVQALVEAGVELADG